MEDVLVIKTLEELRKFLNENGILEIALRDKRKKFKDFVKVSLENLAQEGKTLEEAKSLINNLELDDKTGKMLKETANAVNLSNLLGSLNLVASIAGFAIIYKKLDKIEKRLMAEMSQMHNNIKRISEIQAKLELNKVISNYSNMLDCKKKKKPYSEDQLHSLVASEYDVLKYLIELLEYDVISDKGDIIFSIFSLLGMLTYSLKEFDEIYYFSNLEAIDNGAVWHNDHSVWTDIYTVLSSKEFTKKLQDYAIFDADMTTHEADIFYASLIQDVKDQEESISDNQKLIIAMGDMTRLTEVRNAINADIKKECKKAIGKVKNADVSQACEQAFKQLAM